ncbi:MAG: flagellar hook-associated protein FlgK [Deltaproteobacteria bacterium]|nr:flagellar hook-associated protein FlgK [Deltaproteobacteria bacterium]
MEVSAMSITSLLFTVRDSLLANQMAIDITGANVANVNTPGYTRQRTNMESLSNVDVKNASAQIGVSVNRIERIYDRYIESQVVEQRQKSGYSDTMLQGLQSISPILDDTQGGGISDQLNKFWSAWENLSSNPAGKVEKSALLTIAEDLTGTLASYKRDLDTISTDMNRNIADVVSQINGKADEISDLNEKIITTGGGDNGNKNDLMDKRSEALRELAALVDINQIENPDGTINVYLSNGDSLVRDQSSQHLSVQLVNAQSNVYSASTPDEPINSALTKGKLGAYIELQTVVVPEYVDSINSFTIAFSDRVNALHSSGFDAYKNTGVNFFTITDEDNAAGTIGVNSAIASDIGRIACSLTVSGDGDNASKIASVQYELLMDDNTSTLNGFLASMVGQIGLQVATAKTDNDHQSVLMNHLSNQREAVSGVSIDEEMIMLIKYQMGYTTAGKLCQTVDEMLDTLMGLVK